MPIKYKSLSKFIISFYRFSFETAIATAARKLACRLWKLRNLTMRGEVYPQKTGLDFKLEIWWRVLKTRGQLAVFYNNPIL